MLDIKVVYEFKKTFQIVTSNLGFGIATKFFYPPEYIRAESKWLQNGINDDGWDGAHVNSNVEIL